MVWQETFKCFLDLKEKMPKKDAGITTIEKMNEYLQHIASIYPDEKPSVVITHRQLKRRYPSYRGKLVSRIIDKMMGLGLAEPFSEGGRNPYYQLNLEKTREYLESQSGKE